MSQAQIQIRGTIYRTMLTGANEPSTTTQTFTAATFASVTVPSGATGVYIIPPDVSVGTITFKGATGDTGVNIPQAVPSFMALDPGGAAFGLVCAGNCTITFIWV